MSSHISIYGSRTLSYMKQEVTLSTALTEREPITFTRQAWYGGVIYTIL